MPNVELQGEPGTGVAEDIVKRLLPEWWSLFQPKNATYGGVLATGGGLGIKAFIPEMNRKMAGIVNEVWHGERPQGGSEGAREKAMDLIGHLLIFISNLDANQETGPRVGLDTAAVVDRATGAARAARLSGGDGKAAGLAKVDDLASTGGRWTTAPQQLHIRLTAEDEVEVKQCNNRQVHPSHSWPPDRFTSEENPGYWCDGRETRYVPGTTQFARLRTAEELKADRWPQKADEDPCEPEKEPQMWVRGCSRSLRGHETAHAAHGWQAPETGQWHWCLGAVPSGI